MPSVQQVAVWGLASLVTCVLLMEGIVLDINVAPLLPHFYKGVRGDTKAGLIRNITHMANNGIICRHDNQSHKEAAAAGPVRGECGEGLRGKEGCVRAIPSQPDCVRHSDTWQVSACKSPTSTRYNNIHSSNSTTRYKRTHKLGGLLYRVLTNYFYLFFIYL